MLILCILRDYGMDSCLSWKNGHVSFLLAWLFCAHRRFADCRLQTASDHPSAKCGNLCPGSRPPFGNREAKKELHRLLDEEESK